MMAVANAATFRPQGRRPRNRRTESKRSVSDSILQRIAAGDMAAMQECIDRYGGLVWSLARRLSLSPADAEDGVQEVFIELWKHAERFNPEIAAESTFVGMIARRRLIDRRRSRMTQENHVKTATELPEPSVGRSETSVDLSDEAHQASEAMKQLSDDQQKVLSLAIYHGLTHQQIAETTGMPLGTVKTHARRGLIKVRETLKKREDELATSSSSSEEAK